MESTIIKTYGLFWRRDHVNWNKTDDKGELLGFSRNRKSTERINFNGQIGLYILYHDFKIVYVGQVGKGDKRTLYSRLKDYTRNLKSHRWNQFSWFGIKWVNKIGGLSGGGNISATKEVLLSTIEAILIDGCEPSLNKQGGQWKNAIQYFQRELAGDPSLEEKLDSLIVNQQKLEKIILKMEKRLKNN